METEPTTTAQPVDLPRLVRPFVFGDLWAGSSGMNCEFPCCDGKTFTVWLTGDEDSSLPEQSGPLAAQFIFQNRLGLALCSKHWPNVKDLARRALDSE